MTNKLRLLQVFSDARGASSLIYSVVAPSPNNPQVWTYLEWLTGVSMEIFKTSAKRGETQRIYGSELQVCSVSQGNPLQSKRNHRKRRHVPTKPLTPSFVGRVQVTETKRSKDIPKVNMHSKFGVSASPYSRTHSKVVNDIQSAIMVVFAMCDTQHTGSVEKELFCKQLYNPEVCKLVRDSKSLRCLIRRKGFCHDILKMGTREKGMIAFDEFHSLAFKEKEETEKREAELKARTQTEKRIKRLQKMRDVAFFKKRQSIKLKVDHEIDLRRVELDETKKHILYVRADANREKNQSKLFAKNMNNMAGQKALKIVEEAATTATDCTKKALQDAQKIKIQVQKERSQMLKTEQEQLKEIRRMAEKEINKRWAIEKESMAKVRKIALAEAYERKCMEDAEREERLVMERDLVETLKRQAEQDIKQMRSKTLEELSAMKEEAKRERELLLAQQLREHQLIRERAEEAKETLLKQTRWEMKIVMDRAVEQGEIRKAAAEEEVKAIIERGHDQVRRAQADYANNVRVLEAMEVFKRNVKKEMEDKILIENQRKEAQKKLEEAAIKRQRAEASLRAKQEAIKKREAAVKEKKYTTYFKGKAQACLTDPNALHRGKRNKTQLQSNSDRNIVDKQTEWVEKFDEAYSCAYFYNTRTGQSQWKSPFSP